MKRAQPLALGLMLVAALGVRLQKIGEPPLDFAIVRQYRGLLLARACYDSKADGVPEWRKSSAELNRQRQGVLEPPILETLVCAAYRIGGGERIWIGRALSALFFVIGGVLLAQLARGLIGVEGGIFAAGYYLFLPFAVRASRSFQPDSLMICLLVASLLAIARHDRTPTRRRLVVAALVSAAAMFVKPTCLPVIVGAFLVLAVRRTSLRKALTDRTILTFLCVAIAPCVLFAVYNLVFLGRLREQVRVSFVPYLWFTASYWTAWFDQIDRAVGLPAVLLSAAGVALSRGRTRTLLVALCLGYFAFGLAFPYHIHTHDYYHLQLVPIVALSLGVLVAPIARRLCTSRVGSAALVCAGAVAVAFCMRTASKGIGTRGSADLVRVYEEIGRTVNHSLRTVHLSREYGWPLCYHADISGGNWPTGGQLHSEAVRRKASLSTEERLRWFIERHAEFFIVTELAELEAQPELKRILETRYRKLQGNDRYSIFDLTHLADARS